MQNIAGKPEVMRKMNMMLIYKILIELRTATRAEIVYKTNISTTTVRALLEELLEKGEIVALELDESSGGRRAQRYSLSSERNLVLSLYFEENTIVYQINNLLGTLILTGVEEIEGNDITASVLLFIENCMSKWAVCAIGLGVPGIVENGRYYVSSGVNQWTINNIGEQIHDYFHLPVIMENDLNSIALGFTIKYVNEDVNIDCDADKIHMVYIYFNKSCTGAGIISEGKILHGSRQFAGELGFLPFGPGKTLDDIMREVKNAEEKADAIARVIAIVNCVTNPSLIVIGGEYLKRDMVDVELIRQMCCKYIDDIVRPEITVSSDIRSDYLTGLSSLTIEKLIPRLPLSDILK